MAFATLSGRLFICGSRGLSPPLPDRKVAAAASGGQQPEAAAFRIACVSPFRSRVRTSPASVW
jgi:hypothetical protein